LLRNFLFLDRINRIVRIRKYKEIM